MRLLSVCSPRGHSLKKKKKKIGQVTPLEKNDLSFFFFLLQLHNLFFHLCTSSARMGYWRNRKRASFARTRYWDRNPDDPFFYFFFVRPNFRTGVRAPAVSLSYGHTRMKAPHPIRTAKLSILGPDQYFGRGLQGNLGCCKSFLLLSCAPQE